MPEAHETDDALVAQAQGGDTAAFGQLVERHQDTLFNGISRLVRRREDAEDLTQEAFVKAFRGIGRFQGRAKFTTWLYSIAMNVVISYRRRKGAQRRGNPISLHEGADPDGRPIDATDPGRQPEVVAEHREVRERIEDGIAQLDEEHRTVVVLRDIQGFDYETISDLLACPVGTVKSRLHRARLALREQLKDLIA
jgi:RNA polymerase sigma-70 factor (ECF subfamily)